MGLRKKVKEIATDTATTVARAIMDQRNFASNGSSI
jgi:hypothetical protein